MKTYNELRIESRDPIKVAFKAFRTDWKFMREHGWTREAYIARYGTTRKPTSGDGGPLIWQADTFNHNRVRQAFIAACHDAGWPALRRSTLYPIYRFLVSENEKARWGDLMAKARTEKVPARQSLNEFHGYPINA